MKRKETLLEKNLIELGYHLSHKTYTGKHSDKVDTYVYQKDNGVIEYYVALDKSREHIVHYSFTNHTVLNYTDGILDSLQEINSNFILELMRAYDFALEQATFELKDHIDFVDPFVEESAFDDND